MRVTRKVAVLVAVPLAAAVAFAALAVTTSTGAALRAQQLRQLVSAGAAAGELVHALRTERAAAVLALTVRTPEVSEEFTAAAHTSRRAATGWRRERGRLPDLPGTTAAPLERADVQLARLDGLREQVAGGRGAASAVAFTYRIIVADLIAFRESIPQAGAAPAGVADRLRAAAALSQAAEHIGRLQVAVLRSAAYGSLTPASVQEVTAARTGYVESGRAFEALATERWRGWWEQSATGQEALTARRLQDQVARTPAGAALAVDATAWSHALDDRLQRLRKVAVRVDRDLLDEVTGLRDGQRRLAALQTAGVAAAVATAVALAVALGRPVVRGLRRLRDAAHRVAYDELPAAVSQLDDHEALGGLSPDEFAAQAPPPVSVTGRDELAEVGAAFNAVHREAIRTAAGQALLRMHVAAMFVNLARRGQALAGRLTTALDDAERDEHDPARLARLFEVDLLVTLLGRINDSLLVLGGAAPAVVRTTDESLAAVLAAAQSQVEAYARVEIGVVDPGVTVRAAAVDDVVKLLAELLDNGCAYAPPDTVVRADARRLSDRVVVQITDQGIGIPAARRDELNARLASRPELDLVAVRAMGLTVVGHIASRHGIRVELRPAPGSGTIAEVTLPPAVFTVVPDAQPVPAAPPLPAPVAYRPEPTTQELRLPVFEQVRSRWFGAGTGRAGAAGAGTAADAGWQAAAHAAHPVPAGRTGRGLPKRRPGAQLVPGGVPDPVPVTTAPTPAAATAPATAAATAPTAAAAGAPPAGAADPADRRDPARISASLAAYARGLAAGRARQHASGAATDTEWSPA